MSQRERQQRKATEACIEIEAQPYKQHLEHPFVKVILWRSLDDTVTLYFEETDSARKRLEPAGTLLGRIPTDMAIALSEAGYTLSDEEQQGNKN